MPEAEARAVLERTPEPRCCSQEDCAALAVTALCVYARVVQDDNQVVGSGAALLFACAEHRGAVDALEADVRNQWQNHFGGLSVPAAKVPRVPRLWPVNREGDA